MCRCPLNPSFPAYVLGCQTSLDFAEADQRVRHALAAEGFGILTEIDVAGTLKRKLGVDVAPYVIWGACAPELAHRAIENEPDIGLLLPCNVVLRETATGTVVEALDPVQQLSLAANDALRPLAKEVQDRLNRVLATVCSDHPSAAP